MSKQLNNHCKELVASLIKYVEQERNSNDPLLENEAERAADDLLSKGCRSVLITLGPQGALYVSNEDKNYIHIASPSVTCIDSTGAGDAFIGTLAYFLANRKELGIKKSIEMACIAAADSVTRPGTQKSFPGPEILSAYLDN